MSRDYFEEDAKARLVIHGFIVGPRSEQPISIVVDTGCDFSGIASSSIDRFGLQPRRMRNPITTSLADGSHGSITHEGEAKLRVGTYTSNFHYNVIKGSLAPHDMLLGMDWMIKTNPMVSFNPLSFKVRSGGREHELHAIRPDGDPFYCPGEGYGDPQNHGQPSTGRPPGPPRSEMLSPCGRGGDHHGHGHGSECDYDRHGHGHGNGCDNDRHGHGHDCECDHDKEDELLDILRSLGGLGSMRDRFRGGHSGHTPFWEDCGSEGGRGFPIGAHALKRGHCHHQGSHQAGCRRACKNHNSNSLVSGGHCRSVGKHHESQPRAMVCARRSGGPELKKTKWHNWRDVFGVGSKAGRSTETKLMVFSMLGVKPLQKDMKTAGKRYGRR